MKLLVLKPDEELNDRGVLVDFTDLLKAWEALNKFCEENEDSVGSFKHDETQSTLEHDVGWAADAVASDVKKFIKKLEEAST